MLTLKQFKSSVTADGLVDWSRNYPLEFFWSFPMTGAADDLWPYLSDTSRFNREVGFAPRTQVEKEGRLFVTATMLGIPQEWLEEPWVWQTPKTITSSRTYTKGMAKHFRLVFHLSENKDCSTIYVYFGWQPKNWFWTIFLKATSPMIRKKFARAFAKIDQHIAAAKHRHENALRAKPPELSESAQKKIRQIESELLAKGLLPQAVRHLSQHLATADDMDVEPIRVLKLARKWGLRDEELLSTVLHATRLGLLKISWEVLCPHCRGSRFSASSLGEIPESSSCATCDVEFSTEGPQAIEVVFHAHPSIRKTEPVLYCAAEPAKKAHIKIQRNIQPGQALEFKAHLPEGAYRARYVGAPSTQTIIAQGQLTSVPQDLFTSATEIRVSPNAHFRAKNQTDRELLLVIEDLAWSELALKPSHLLALPEFRDLFREEHLSSNVKLFLGEQTILFTDIVGSTKFYSEVGDAKAFAEVRTHFHVVFKEVQAHHGIVVKTIGDAVMASFPSVHDAMTAAIQVQKYFNGGRSDTAIRLRISVHHGSVIAVQLNTGIDYFGNTVNLAAKIQACVGAHEIAMSEEVMKFYNQAPLADYKIEKRLHNPDGLKSADVYVLKVETPTKPTAN